MDQRVEERILQRKAQRDYDKETRLQAKRARSVFVQHFVKDEGVRFTHLRNRNIYGEVVPKGGVTIAWAWATPRHNRIELSLAQVHPTDYYCKEMGRYYATQRFAQAECITITVPKNTRPTELLSRMFSEIADQRGCYKP